MAYLALAGELPFRGGSPMAQIAQRATLDVPPLLDRAPDVPERLAVAIDRALNRSPSRRWPTAEAFRQALVGAVESRAPLLSRLKRLLRR